MLHAAHACTYRWKFVGAAVQRQRGKWLISHVHALLEHSAEALRHAERSFELTESNKDMMQHFDIAYAYEGLARAYALAGDRQKAREFLDLARLAGEMIADPEDKPIFLGDFEGGQ